MPTARPILNVPLDESTRAALRVFCAEHGVSSSALIEAVTRALTAGRQPTPRWITQAVTAARRIDVERRRRA